MKKKLVLADMTVAAVRKFFVENPSMVHADTSIDELLKKINKDPRTRHVYVVDDDNRLIGSVRMNTVVKYLFPMTSIVESVGNVGDEPFLAFGARTAKNIMNMNPFFVHETTSLAEMASILMREKINELPVVDEQMHIIGQVNMYEVIKAYLDVTQ